MLRIAGVLVLLLALYGTLGYADANAFGASNLIDVTNRQGFFAVLTLGVAVLIITGAIDLSIGSVAGLSAITFGLLMGKGYHPAFALAVVLLGGMAIGLVHGLLVTQLRLQAFLVTLCGLFVYRGLARYLTEKPVGIVGIARDNPSFVDPINALRAAFVGKDAESVLHYPMQMAWALALTLAVGLVLHKSVVGRYLFAIGYNESAARYSGISTKRHRLIAFVLSSTLASFAGALMLLDIGTADPNNAGETWELYAITGAVLGGCSLKGGEGTAIGIVLGAMVLPLLKNTLSFLEIRDAVIPAVIGFTLLLGTMADEFFRWQARRRK